MLDVCSKPFTPQGKTGSLGFPSKYMVLCQGFVYGESILNLCYPFDVGIFSFIQYAQYVGVTQLRSGFSQRELLYLSLYSWCICGKRKIQELPMSPSWFGVIKILINIFVTIYEFSMLRDITSILQMIIMSQRGLRNSFNIMQLECIRSKI